MNDSTLEILVNAGPLAFVLVVLIGALTIGSIAHRVISDKERDEELQRLRQLTIEHKS